MIISQFRKYTQINILLLVLFGMVLCLGAFFHLPDNLLAVFFEPAISNFTGELFEKGITPEANVLLTLAVTVLQAIFLNYVVNEYGLVGRPGYLPALMYVTVASLILPFLVLSPIIICNFLSIWMIQKLLSLYRRTEIKPVMFDLGMIVAIGSLVYFPFVSMLLLLWISLYIFRAFNWREWVIPPIGFIAVYFLLATLYFLLDRLDEFYEIWLPFTYTFPTSINIDIYDHLVALPVLFILVLFLLTLRKHIFKSVVHIRKSFLLLFSMLVLSIVSFYLNPDLAVNHFLLCVPPVSIYMAYYFSFAGTRWFYESAYVFLLLAIIYFQFF